MKAKNLLLPVFAMFVIFNSCKKAKPANDNNCVKQYQDRIAKLKEEEESNVKNCNNAGGPGNADCLAKIQRYYDSLQKVAVVEFQDCVKKNH